MADGLPIDESHLYNPEPLSIVYSGGSPTVETLGMYANRDPRFYGTILFPGMEFNGIIYNSYPSCNRGAPEGYCSPTSDRILLTDYNNTYTGYKDIKYVEQQEHSATRNSRHNTIKKRIRDLHM